MAISIVHEKILHHLSYITAEPVQTFTLSIGLLLICISTTHLLFIYLQEEEKTLSKTMLRTLTRLSRAFRAITPFNSSITEQNVADTADQLRSTAVYGNRAAHLSAATTNLTLERIDEICLKPANSNTEATVAESEDDTELSTSAMVVGLTNTGNSCFLNSVLQSLSSLPTLQAYLQQVHRSTTTTAPSSIPITRSLLKTLLTLTKPSPENRFFRPKEMVAALSINNDIINREQQDAQELYQLLMNELDTEVGLVKKGQQSSNGFKDILDIMERQPSPLLHSSKTKQQTDEFINMENPLNGLLAYKMTCTECGSMSGIPLQLFNNIQLTLPNDKDHTSLNDCLEQLTSVEYLQDVECQQCTLRYHHKSTTSNLNFQHTTISPLSPTSPPIIKTEKIKQAMFVKPPKILCLHFVRSMYMYTGEIVKNSCKVDFPELLDLTPYCNTTFRNNETLSVYDTNPTARTTTLPLTPPPTPPTAKKYTYRLMSMVVHYGDHYSGHYIAYKRRIVANTCSCKTCQQNQMTLGPSKGFEWYRISDDIVRLCSIEDARSENPFMLMYELVEESEGEKPLLITAASTCSADANLSADNYLFEQQEQEMAEQEMAELVFDTSSDQSSSSGSSSEDEDEDEALYQPVPAAPPSSPSIRPIFNKQQKQTASVPQTHATSLAAHPLASNSNYNIVHRKERRFSSISVNNIPLTDCRSIPIIIQ